MTPSPSAQTVTAPRQHSQAAWKIASGYSDVLASETRDLAAQIDAALGEASYEIAALREANHHYRDSAAHDAWTIAAASARIGELEKVLRPFAMLGLWRDLYPDAKADTLTDRRLQGIIAVEDVRKARAALSQTEDGR